MVRSMYGVKLVDKKLAKNLMQMLDLNETIDHLEKVNCPLAWTCIEKE